MMSSGFPGDSDACGSSAVTGLGGLFAVCDVSIQTSNDQIFACICSKSAIFSEAEKVINWLFTLSRRS